MAKKITQIQADGIQQSPIEIGAVIYGMVNLGKVSKIEYREGELTLSHLGHSLCNKESYIIHFEGTTKTLEVFDVNYVIRDDVEG